MAGYMDRDDDWNCDTNFSIGLDLLYNQLGKRGTFHHIIYNQNFKCHLFFGFLLKINIIGGFY